MSVFLFIIYLLIILGFTYWASKKYLTTIHPLITTSFFGLKFLISLFFLFVYTYHYGGGELTADAGKFFKESVILHEVFFKNPSAYFSFLTNIGETEELIHAYLSETNHWSASERILPNDSRNVIRINSIILFLSQGEILTHFLFFSFFSFLGGLDLFQFIKKISKLNAIIILLFTTLIPSVAFWGGSIIKEPLMLLGLCLLIRAFFDKIHWKRKAWRIIIGGSLMLMFKPYILACLLVAVIFFWIIQYIIKKQRLVAFVLYIIVGFTLLKVTGNFDKIVGIISKQQEDFINLRDGGLYLIDDEEHYHYIYYINRSKFEIKDGYATLLEPTGSFYMKKSDNFDRKPHKLTEVGKTWEIGVQLSQAGSGVDVTPIRKSFSTMVKIIPEVLFISLVRPLPSDDGSWLKYLAFIENIVMLILLAFSFIIFPRKLNNYEQNVLISFSIFALAVLLIVGWTTPVLGAVVRYKVPATLVLGLIILIKARKLPFLKENK